MLEVLLTTILSVTLLAGLWSLYSIYLRLFETGQARAEQSQLARALFQQLSDDLHSAIEDTPIQDAEGESSTAAAGSESVRRFALFGSQHELRFDVLQVVPLEETPRLDADVGERYRTTPTRQVPELRTVFYKFEEPDAFLNSFGEASEEETDQPTLRPGLTRRELDYETPYVEEEHSLAEREFTGVTDSPVGDSGRELPTDTSFSPLLDTDPEDDSIMWVPEVVKLEFRYFDGSGWSSEWDSLGQESLPVAIEVVMQVRPSDESELDLPEDREAVQEEDRLNSEAELGFEDGTDSAGRRVRQPGRLQFPIYRVLIDLPSAKKHPAVKRPSLRPAAPSFVLPAPLPAPRAVVPRPVVPRLAGRTPSGPAASAPSKSDQWMRAGP